MQWSSISSGTDKITTICYEYAFDVQPVVVLKYMVKEINTKNEEIFEMKN